jgi:hypothetical protein
VAVVRKRTIPTERPQLVGEVSANLCGYRVLRGQLLDRSRYFFIQVAPQLSSRGWVDPVPDTLLLRKSGRARNRTQDVWICSQKLWPLDQRGGPSMYIVYCLLIQSCYTKADERQKKNSSSLCDKPSDSQRWSPGCKFGDVIMCCLLRVNAHLKQWL